MKTYAAALAEPSASTVNAATTQMDRAGPAVAGLASGKASGPTPGPLPAASASSGESLAEPAGNGLAVLLADGSGVGTADVAAAVVTVALGDGLLPHAWTVNVAWPSRTELPCHGYDHVSV